MRLTALANRFVGRWAGNSTLYTSWLPTKENPSGSALVVAPAAKGKFLTFTYTWVYEGTEHEGLLLVGNENEADEATASFVDSWHMSNAVMPFKGTVGEDGVIRLLGSYAAPPGPDWGWRIEIRVDGEGLHLDMFNITPEGEEDIAVRAVYRRAG